MSSTNTNMALPTCDNCGRDKSPTYICDVCCDKLNAAICKRTTDYAKLEAENANATHQIESLANQCQFQAERLVALEEELEHWKTGSAYEAHFGDEARRDLAAANATLDRLREVFMRLCKGNEMSEAIDDMDAILYPTQETPND